MNPSKLFLEVIGGSDHGARLTLDAPTRTIGRARGCDLVLHDATISRQHAIVARTETGSFHLETCQNVSPAIVISRAGQPVHETVRHLELVPGIEFLLNSIHLVVRSSNTKRAPVSMRDDGGATERRGIGVSVGDQTALNTLIEVLDKIEDVDDLEPRMREWCVEHWMAAGARLDSSETRATTTTILNDGDGMVHLAVPTPDGSATLVFTCRSANGEIPDSLRKTLVMAGRLFASALTRARRLRVVADDVATFRAVAIGSARRFLGSSAAARKFARIIPKLAASDVNVLLEGETGSGKSFVARLIHEHGPHATERFRRINCAAIPGPLIESELFGHERGAFTGAVKSRMGVFEEAGRGTVFLDEIGELSLSSQAKLLRVLEERRFERLGSNRTISLEARVVCASNRDLKAMMNANEFRSDLFYRISVIHERVPSLRERSEDIPLLAEQALRDLAASATTRRVEGFSKKAVGALRCYAWPGNVRELRNAIEHALVHGTGSMIDVFDLPPAIAMGIDPTSSTPFQVSLPADLASLERRAIEVALAVANGHRVRAAGLLGISRQTLYNKLAEYELSEMLPDVPKKKNLQ